MNLINEVLTKNDLKLRIVDYRRDSIVLNSGKKIINPKEKCNFRNRCLSEKTTFLPFLDKLYFDKTTPEEIASILNEIKAANAKYAGSKIDGNVIREKAIEGYRSGKRTPWNKGKKGLQICWSKGLTKHTHPSLMKMSNDRKGNNNPAVIHNIWTKEHRQKLSNIQKNSIKNGKFTPGVNNSRTHWQSQYKNMKFRSSWESVFYSMHKHQIAYEKYRISYYDSQKMNFRVYIVDFFDKENKKLYEIKPKSFTVTQNWKDKEKAIQEHCSENGLSFHLITEHEIYSLLTTLPEQEKCYFDLRTLKKLNDFRKKYEASEKN